MIWKQRMVAITAAASVLVLGTGAAPIDAEARKPRVDSFTVQGDVKDRRKLTAADVAALPQHTITVNYLSGSTPETHTYTGALLIDVLNLATPDFNPRIRNDKLSFALTAVGSDGYEATVAWGEFDPDFEAKTILVAITEDGVPLGDAGPRLIVPGDRRGGRYVSDVVRLKLADA